MDLFTYLMAKNGNNTSVHGDLFSYLLGKGQSQTYTVSGVTIYIPDAKKLVSFMMTKESTQETTTGKNLLPNLSQSQTLNGLTITINNDKTIKINGVASAQTTLTINNLLQLSAGSYKLTGCPSGGGEATYELQAFGGLSNTVRDRGTGASLTALGSGDTTVNVVIRNGVTCNNLIFKPMIVEGEELVAYEEYTGGIPSPNPDYPQEVKTVKGYRNLLNLNNLSAQTTGGITFTPVYKDGLLQYISASGTATGGALYYLRQRSQSAFSAGTYRLSGCPSGGSSSSYYIFWSPSISQTVYDYGNGATRTFTQSETSIIYIAIVTGTTVNDLRFYPMLVEGTQQLPYVPYGNNYILYKQVGKNLWSLENQYSFTSSESTWYFINGVKGAYGSKIGNKTQKKFFCKSGKTYIFQMTFDSSVSSSSMVWSDETYTGITRISPTSSSGKVEIKIIGKDDYVIPRIYMYANSSINITNVMIEEVSSSATSASEYEPYQEKDIPIPLNNNEIVGIGDYKDELLVDKSGHVFINKKCGKKVLTGSNAEGWTTESDGYYGTRNEYFADRKLFTASNQGLISNYFKVALSGNNTIRWRGSNEYNAMIRYNDMTSLENFKTWLSTHNTTVYYVLAQENLIDLQTTVDLKLFKGVNNVSNSEDAYMTIEYR